MGELWESRVQSAASQRASPLPLGPPSPPPSPPPPPTLPPALTPPSSNSVSLLAENHRRLRADLTLRPQTMWENRPGFMLRSEPTEDNESARLRQRVYLHVVLGVAPVPLGVQVAQVKFLLLAQMDLCHGAADLARHEVCT